MLDALTPEQQIAALRKHQRAVNQPTSKIDEEIPDCILENETTSPRKSTAAVHDDDQYSPPCFLSPRRERRSLHDFFNERTPVRSPSSKHCDEVSLRSGFSARTRSPRRLRVTAKKSFSESNSSICDDDLNLAPMTPRRTVSASTERSCNLMASLTKITQPPLRTYSSSSKRSSDKNGMESPRHRSGPRPSVTLSPPPRMVIPTTIVVPAVHDDELRCPTSPRHALKSPDREGKKLSVSSRLKASVDKRHGSISTATCSLSDSSSSFVSK